MNIINPLRFLWLPVLLLTGCASIAADSGTDQKVAERFLNANKGVLAIVFNEQGEPVNIVGKDGAALTPCQLCTRELEAKLGPQCGLEKRLKASAEEKARADASGAPKVCYGAIGTTVHSITPVSVMQHNSSNCMTITYVVAGVAHNFQFCVPPY